MDDDVVADLGKQLIREIGPTPEPAIRNLFNTHWEKVIVDSPTRELPRYRSHKEVWALKIDSITPLDDGSATIVPLDHTYEPMSVSEEYMRKHQPRVGGYWVLYADGYQSWSPAEAFEEGYTKVA